MNNTASRNALSFFMNNTASRDALGDTVSSILTRRSVTRYLVTGPWACMHGKFCTLAYDGFQDSIQNVSAISTPS